MSKERRMVALIRRLTKELADCPYDKIDVCSDNLKTAYAAAEKLGLSELASAAAMEDVVDNELWRRIIFNTLEDPTAFFNKTKANIERHREYLT